MLPYVEDVLHTRHRCPRLTRNVTSSRLHIFSLCFFTKGKNQHWRSPVPPSGALSDSISPSTTCQGRCHSTQSTKSFTVGPSVCSVFHKVTKIMSCSHTLVTMFLFQLRSLLNHMADHTDMRSRHLSKMTYLSSPVLQPTPAFGMSPRISSLVSLFSIWLHLTY